MRYALVALLFASASAASAGPFEFLGGIPDAPGVVHGGSFGLTGHDYYGSSQTAGAGRTEQATRHAKARLRHPAPEKRLPKS
ncbi:hypothetical protein [Methylobacterium sp. Leaf102]|uniref:hypothetical protein n=1 Tax=Methylobacterium sp. Leaf102 TaxID=1736253 RepID=UPI0012E99029|nr:hypothetical protein [Methylobacterium sp. Leaf102]